jgi:hypothetical protein
MVPYVCLNNPTYIDIRVNNAGEQEGSKAETHSWP